VLVDQESGARVRPGDAALPGHAGTITTRALQEWACLLAHSCPSPPLPGSWAGKPRRSRSSHPSPCAPWCGGTGCWSGLRSGKQCTPWHTRPTRALHTCRWCRTPRPAGGQAGPSR
jgi:hypothetical protein